MSKGNINPFQLLADQGQGQDFQFLRTLVNRLQNIQTSDSASVSDSMIYESTSRHRQLSKHISIAKRIKSIDQDAGYNFKHSVSTGFQPTAPVEIIPANRVSLNDLLGHVGIAWLGKYFLCRTIAWPTQQNSIQIIVEDPPGGNKCILLSLYNWILEEEMDQNVLPIGARIIIKNPYLKITGSGELGIRVDNPAEVEIITNEGSGDNSGCTWGPLDLTINRQLREDVPTTCSSAEYKAKGNQYVRQGKLHSAIRCYTFAIREDPNNVMLFTNRACCYLKIGKPEKALKDSEVALVLEAGNIKAIWRKSVALSRLNKHDEAIAFLTSNESIVSTSSDLRSLQESLTQLNNEYNFTADGTEIGIYLNSKEFKGPVKVVQISGKGRGMIVTEDIPAGYALISSRAFDLVTENAFGNETVLNTNINSSTINTPTFARLLASIALRLKENPEYMDELYQLYAGPKYQALDPNNPTKEKDAKSPLLIDMERIEQVLHYNAFGEGDLPLSPISRNKNSEKVWTGLWILPSFINHSCTEPNAGVILCGDFIYIVTTKCIPAGAEVLISYFGPDTKYEERKRRTERYGFICKCRLCKRRN